MPRTNLWPAALFTLVLGVDPVAAQDIPPAARAAWATDDPVDRWISGTGVPIDQTRAIAPTGMTIGDVARASSAKIPDGAIDRSAVDVRAVDVDWDVIDALALDGQSRLGLPLPEGGRLELVLLSSEVYAPGHALWYGQIAGVANSSVLLARYGETIHLVAQNLNPQGRTFELRSVAPGAHAIVEKRAAPEVDEIDCRSGTPSASGWAFPDAPALQKVATDPSTVVDVMVIATDSARGVYGSEGAFVAAATAMVGDANLRLSTSGAPWTFRLCAAPWTLVAGYADSGDLETDLTRLSNPADGFLDAVPADRSIYRPDLVCLITNSGTGLGYAPAITAELTVSSGYSVVALDLSITNGTFAHEVGHNMGGKHNAEQPDGVSGINGTAQGIARYCDVPDGICGSCEDREFRTTMSYAVSTSVPSQRIQRYSVNGLQATLNGSLGSCTVDLWSATAQAILTFEVSRPLVSNYNVASSQLWVQPGVNGVGTFLSPRRSVREALAVVQGGFAEGVLKVRAGTLDETGLVGGPAQLSGAGRIEAVGGVVTIE